ncbi:hypothetical protein FRC12_016082 [Ceratobasidium sp. 428]|nr:hypothetical protein FRC12_016082 [Ceratobasidium sp. 428]
MENSNCQIFYQSSDLIPKSLQVFSIPELAIIIIRNSARQDRARMLRTCKLLFNVAVPFVWEHVDGAKHLLLLLNAAYEIHYRGANPPFSHTFLTGCVQINDPFVRFDFYAPYVKSLDVCGSKDEMIGVTGWKVLIARSRQKPLLPNLHTLTITSFARLEGPDQPAWVGAFSCPSLINLEVGTSDLRSVLTVSYPAASFIMRSLGARCPKIERLSLFPSIGKEDRIDDVESGLLPFPREDIFFYMHAATLTYLRHLSCSYAWLQPLGIQILGRLPYLESITTCYADSAIRGYLSPTMNEDLFPMLRYLYLHEDGCLECARVMETTQMVKNLTSLHISLGMSYYADAGEESWIMDKISPLLLNAPNLMDLRIDANQGSDEGYVYYMDESVLRVFQRLLLKSLHLGEIRLYPQALSLDLASVWPFVTSLRIPWQPASLETISRFAELPNLLELELRLDLRKPTREYSKTMSHLTVLEASRSSKICSDCEDIEQITRELHNIFPDITRVAWPNTHIGWPSDLREGPAKTLEYERAEFLNRYLATLREFQTLK